jgi:hypothetical protein
MIAPFLLHWMMIRILLLLLVASTVYAQKTVSIDASPVVRIHVPIFIKISKPSDHNYGLLNASTGKTYPLQWSGDSAVFIPSDTIPAGQSPTLSLKKLSNKRVKALEIIQLKKTQGTVTVLRHGVPVFVYNIAELMPPADSPAYYKRSGFIHPLYTPSGRVITDAFPSTHAHQHALFHAWTNTNYKGKHVDFWNQHQKQGTVGNAKLISLKEGLVYAELVTKQEYIGLAFGTILEEFWTIRIYNSFDKTIFDIAIRQQNITQDTLHLDKYIYGGMAFRGSEQWDKFNKKTFQEKWSLLTSEGIRDTLANNTAAKWVMVTGHISGIASTATVIGHPSNFRYPQKIRVHPEMPYWVFSPVIDEGFKMPPGAFYNARYRYLITDEPPTSATIQSVSDSW